MILCHNLANKIKKKLSLQISEGARYCLCPDPYEGPRCQHLALTHSPKPQQKLHCMQLSTLFGNILYKACERRSFSSGVNCEIFLNKEILPSKCEKITSMIPLSKIECSFLSQLLLNSHFNNNRLCNMGLNNFLAFGLLLSIVPVISTILLSERDGKLSI